MDFDEFQESEVFFSDYSFDRSEEINEDGNGGERRRIYNANKKEMRRINISSSLPVNIPAGINALGYIYDIHVARPETSDEEFADDEEEEHRTMGRLPPHLIVERRVNGEMARSFSPLKGRYLCEVRNSILRKTGFLER